MDNLKKPTPEEFRIINDCADAIIALAEKARETIQDKTVEQIQINSAASRIIADALLMKRKK